MIVARRLLTLSLMAALAATALAACREEEQGRPLAFNKGSYAGPTQPATPVSTAAAKEMQDRAKKQQF